jgi:hypothetical protein
MHKKLNIQTLGGLEITFGRALGKAWRNGCLDDINAVLHKFGRRFDSLGSSHCLLFRSRVHRLTDTGFTVKWVNTLAQMGASKSETPTTTAYGVYMGPCLHDPFRPCFSCSGSGCEIGVSRKAIGGIPSFVDDMDRELRDAIKSTLDAGKLNPALLKFRNLTRAFAPTPRHSYELFFCSKYFEPNAIAAIRILYSISLSIPSVPLDNALQRFAFGNEPLMKQARPCRDCGGSGYSIYSGVVATGSRRQVTQPLSPIHEAKKSGREWSEGIHD